MKISEMINALEEFKQEHGDMPCVVYDGCDPSELVEARTINHEGELDWLGDGDAVSITP
jgi:hypothetical protein